MGLTKGFLMAYEWIAWGLCVHIARVTYLWAQAKIPVSF
jgi:hypothetical protein